MLTTRERLGSGGGRLAAVAALVVVIAVLASRVAFLHAPVIDYDEGVYWLSMRSMQAGHPLFGAVYSSQPPAFLAIAEPIWAFLGSGIAAGRVVMLAWWVAAIPAGAYIGWRLGGGVAAAAVAVVLCVDPLGVRQSVVLQPDGPGTALAVIAVALGVGSVSSRNPRRADLLAALTGAALALGELTKLFDIGAIPPLVALLLFTRQDRGRLAMAAGLGAVLAAVVVLLPYARDLSTVWNQAVGTHLGTRGITYGIHLGQAMLAHTWVIDALAAFGALVGWRRHPRLVLIGLLWVGGAVATMATLNPLWPHHSVSATPGLALLDAAGFSSVFGWLANQRAGKILATSFSLAGVGGAVAILLVSGVLLFPRSTSPASAEVVQALDRLTPPSGYVLSDDEYDQAVADRQAPPQFVDTSRTRITGQGITATTLESAVTSDPVCAVLFQSGKLASVAGFQGWVAANFTSKVEIGRGVTLYLRPGCGSR
ncbi:MAG: hypothetical protein WCB85_13530 [Candidatus Dormiibacterota bacterium]